MYAAKAGASDKKGDAQVRLGKFSVSLTVKDIAASRAFYEKLGFKVSGGDQAQKWLVLQNETATVGPETVYDIKRFLSVFLEHRLYCSTLSQCPGEST